MNDVIDLCDSDEEEEKQPTVARRTKQSKPTLQDDDDDDDDCEIISPVKKQIFVTPETLQNKEYSSSDEEKRKQQRRPRSLFPKKVAKKASSTFGFSSSDEESSDDELLNFQALARKKMAKPAALLSKENNASTPRQDSKKARFKSPKPPPVVSAASSSVSSSFFHPYARKPQTIISTRTTNYDFEMEYPTLNHSGQYEDLRVKYILAMWKYSQTLVHASHNLGKLDQFSKKINSLVLSKFPIRSFEEYCQRFVGTSTFDTSSIQEALQAGGFDRISTQSMRNNDGRYFSIAEACLVSMLSYTESKCQNEFSTNLESINDETLQSFLPAKDSWVDLSDLLPMIDNRLKDVCPGRLTRRSDDDNGASFYNEKSTRSAEYKQIEKLQTKQRGTDESFIKAHRKNGEVCFELTPLGYRTAVWIKNRAFPSPPGHYRTSNLSQVEPRFQGICLAVDKREGGGPKKKLHTMCNKLDTLKMPYFVCTLDIGDYCFFTGNKLLPVLIERKSIQDVAHSIFDGRWTSQKKRMYQGQFVFGYNNCRIAYIIEGRKEAQQLTGGYVGQRQFNVTSEQLDEEIDNLQSEGFDVLKTQTPDHSMVELSRWATTVLQDYRNGKLTAEYTFDEFRNKVKKIPRNTDFSRIAKDEAQSRQQKQEAATVETKEAKPKKEIVQTTLLGRIPKTQTKTKGSDQYKGWTVAKLKEECEKAGLTKGGKKADLIERLNGPRPPKLWLKRKAKGEYVPSKFNNCATALLVGLWLEQSKHGSDWKGMTKEELYALAESLDISKDPFSGIATGPFKYDGWSSMSDLRTGGEVPLVVLKRGHFKLTTSCDIAGYPLAEVLHTWCHEHNKCKCHEIGY